MPSAHDLNDPSWFWGRVDKNGPAHPYDPELGACWVYTGKQVKLGYGYFIHKRKEIRASRYMYFLEHGEWPSDCILHSCDNRLCVNPRHLWVGSKSENNRDRDAKGRTGRPSGERNGMAKITASQVCEIRSLHHKMTHREIAERFGLSPSYVKLIFAKLRWAHVECPISGRGVSGGTVPKPATDLCRQAIPQ